MFYSNRILLWVFLCVCFQASAQMNYILEKLPDSINSIYDEITPVPGRDGKSLFFTRYGFPDFNQTLLIDSVDQAIESPSVYIQSLSEVYTQIAGYKISNPIASAFNQDVWFCNLSDSFLIQDIQHPPYPLNNALPNSLVTITPDPNAFYIINQFEKNGNMDRGFSLIKRQGSNNWSFPEAIKIQDYYTITSDVSLTMSFDGKVLILSATRADSKDMDLYVCFKEGLHQWSAPKHLGKTINSPKRETTPFLSEDNETLYFSSNRWNTSGGNDIFQSKRLDDTWTNWSEPDRLSAPINSIADDGQPYFNMSSGYLYFTSKRAGSSDIYRVRIAPPQPTELVVNGRILHHKTKELITNARLWYGAENEGQNSLDAPDGTFSLRVTKGVNFTITPSKPGFNGVTEKLFYPRMYFYFRDQEIEVYVDPIAVGEKITLQSLYFQQSKPIILESSYAELERLAMLLKETPNMHIRIEGHTDDHGRAEDLLVLSEARAMAVKQFLISNNIQAERIETIGYGAKFPINDNSSEEQRALNRRVEIQITRI
jgi:outer membrane protein OmpA-like peptidoglycan-associated protein